MLRLHLAYVDEWGWGAGIAVLVVAASIAASAFILTWRQRRIRRQRMEQFAVARGFRFAADDPLGDSLAALPLMRQSTLQGGRNVVWGEQAGRQVMLFEYQYSVGGGGRSIACYHACCTWRLDGQLPLVALRPKEFFDHVGDGFPEDSYVDVRTGDPPFDETFHISGASPAMVRHVLGSEGQTFSPKAGSSLAVHNVLSEEMRAFILRSGIRYLEIDGDLVLLYRREHLTPATAEWLLETADGLNTMLQYLVTGQVTSAAVTRVKEV